MKKFNVEAIVLKNINYKDSHRIYTLLTKEKGKLSAVARGVRKISSRRSGSLDTLNNVSVALSEDKGGFYSITEVKIINSFANLKKSLDFIFAGLYFAELVDSFLGENHESPEIFNLLKTALTVLSKRPKMPERIVNVFECRIMDKLGFGLVLENFQTEQWRLLKDMKFEKDISVVMSYNQKTAKQASEAIKTHLKQMVEIYGRYPKLNGFLSESVSGV